MHRQRVALDIAAAVHLTIDLDPGIGEHVVRAFDDRLATYRPHEVLLVLLRTRCRQERDQQDRPIPSALAALIPFMPRLIQLPTRRKATLSQPAPATDQSVGTDDDWLLPTFALVPSRERPEPRRFFARSWPPMNVGRDGSDGRRRVIQRAAGTGIIGFGLVLIVVEQLIPIRRDGEHGGVRSGSGGIASAIWAGVVALANRAAPGGARGTKA